MLGEGEIALISERAGDIADLGGILEALADDELGIGEDGADEPHPIVGIKVIFVEMDATFFQHWLGKRQNGIR